MEVQWSLRAAEDLERIFRRIEQDNPLAARQVVKTIAVYQVKEYTVEISRIYHGAQDWPNSRSRGFATTS